jgi:hypothetical protein
VFCCSLRRPHQGSATSRKPPRGTRGQIILVCLGNPARYGPGLRRVARAPNRRSATPESTGTTKKAHSVMVVLRGKSEQGHRNGQYGRTPGVGHPGGKGATCQWVCALPWLLPRFKMYSRFVGRTLLTALGAGKRAPGAASNWPRRSRRLSPRSAQAAPPGPAWMR